MESRCGLDCSECLKKEEYGCEGCLNMTLGFWGSECEIKNCCELKKISHCGLCKDFPCKLLSDISYDVDTGDDGERLMNCKNAADNIDEKKWSDIRRMVLGLSVGIISGALIGSFQEMIIPWFFAGVLIGCGMALMVNIVRRK